jgi:predicted nucleotidyltransferase
MITAKQLKIFEVLVKRPFAEHFRKEIKKESGEKSNNALALAINSLKKLRILSERKVGKSGILTLNLKNDLIFQYIALCNSQRISHLANMAVNELKDELDEITPFYAMALFGSYATNKQKQNSDLDLAVFIESEEKRKKITASINSAKLKSSLKIDAYVIPMDEMIEMLTNKEENLGKQIARKHMAVHNHQIFYELVLKGMKHGFRVSDLPGKGRE